MGAIEALTEFDKGHLVGYREGARDTAAAQCSFKVVKVYLDDLAEMSELLVRMAERYIEACFKGRGTDAGFEALKFHCRQTKLMLKNLGYWAQ